jgi:hypothetical protein
MRRGIVQAFARAETFFKTLRGELETLDGKQSALRCGSQCSCTSGRITTVCVSIQPLAVSRLMCFTQGKPLNGVYLTG